MAGSELESQKYIACLGSQVHSFVSKSFSCMGESMNCLAIRSINIPVNRSTASAMLIDSVKEGGDFFFVSHVNLSPAHKEEAICSLHFTNNIKNCRNLALGPFKRNIRVDKDILEREVTKLEKELMAAGIVVQYKRMLKRKRPEELNDDVIADIIEKLRTNHETEMEKKNTELEKEVNSLVNERAESLLRESREKKDKLESREAELKAEVKFLQVSLTTSAKDYGKKMKQLELELESSQKKAAELDEEISKKEETVESFEEKKRSLQLELQKSPDEIRATALEKIAEQGKKRQLWETERKKWAEQRQKWRKTVLKEKSRTAPEFCIIKEPVSRGMLSRMKQFLQGVKASVEDTEAQMEPLREEKKVHKVALRYMEKHIVDWNLEFGVNESMYEEAEEKDLELRSIAEGLVLYLQHGTTALKVCDSMAHERHFFISADRRFLCWSSVDKNGKPNRGKYKRLAFSDVKYFILGQYSRRFVNFYEEYGFSEDDFYRSFSLYYANGKRTVDVITESDADFEAWIVGLFACLGPGKEPNWGAAIDISGMPGFGELEIDEVEFCQQHHIAPYYYLNVKEILLLEQQQRGYVTGYDVRRLFGLDIIRCINVHKLLKERGEICARPPDKEEEIGEENVEETFTRE